MSPAKRRGLGRGLDALLTSNKEIDGATQSNLTSDLSKLLINCFLEFLFILFCFT